jgi:UDP-glucose 4-epimerase
MQKRNVLVTGGLGFIGSNLVDELISNNHKVYVIDNLVTGSKNYSNSNAEYDLFDLTNESKLFKLVNMIKPSWVFHLAALPRIQPSFEDPITHDDNNIRNTLKLINVIKSFNIEALVNSSSSSIYGNPENFPTSENENINPLSPYALQKYTSEYYIKILCNFYKIPATSLRYFNPYGNRSFNPENPLNAYSSVIGIFLNKKYTNKPLTVFGNGEQSRDFVHVNDVAKANICVAENIKISNNNSYNVGYGSTHKIIDIAKYISNNIDYKPERTGEAQITWANISKLQTLGWSPKIDVFDYLSNELSSNIYI